MYPDWPESFDDLVPLPLCEGPKLKSFDLQGPQKIKFIDYVGTGSHSHVFKVEILGEIYALKLFRFCHEDEWMHPDLNRDMKDMKLMTAFANYSEPFNCECRAFGRLQETDNCGLAIKCFGYILLDEDHEKTMLDLYMDKNYHGGGEADLRFDFYLDETNFAYMSDSYRSHYRGKSGRPPPIRGIVKEFGPDSDKDLRLSTVLSVKRDIIAIHQLGMLHLDPATRNFGNGKIVDFSTALTIPHYCMTPELNPHLTPEWISAMEVETFRLAIRDYLDLEEMVLEWNEEHELAKDKISFSVFPRRRYELRKQSDVRVYTLVDPRLFDWRTFSTGSRHHQSTAVNGRSSRKANKNSSKSHGAISKTYQQLNTKPLRWYLDDAENRIAENRIAEKRCTPSVFGVMRMRPVMTWQFKDGLLFPRTWSDVGY